MAGNLVPYMPQDDPCIGLPDTARGTQTYKTTQQAPQSAKHSTNERYRLTDCVQPVTLQAQSGEKPSGKKPLLTWTIQCATSHLVVTWWGWWHHPHQLLKGQSLQSHAGSIAPRQLRAAAQNQPSHEHSLGQTTTLQPCGPAAGTTARPVMLQTLTWHIIPMAADTLLLETGNVMGQTLSRRRQTY